MQQSGCVAGSNGGFFDMATFEPNGLMISNGQSVGRFDRSNWAEGVLAVCNGRPELAFQAKFNPDESITHLLQTGPWLVQDGKPRNDFANDFASNPRTFIATDGVGTWLLGHVSGNTLRDLSSILCCNGMKQILFVREALNLDGGPSSGYWVQSALEQICYIEESTTVRNFIGIRKRLPNEHR
ncbi:phosphodiester glycosidase family protein [Verrucomicrobiota bacterium sgz303538]